MSKIRSKFVFHDSSTGSPRAEDRLPGGKAGAPQFAGEPVDTRRSPLAELVSNYLRSNSLRQIDFCRQVGFDQGLLSKILSSVVSTLNVETAIKLAEGMNLPAGVIFEAIGKRDVHEMLMRVYSGTLPVA